MQTRTQNEPDNQLRSAVAMHIDWEPEVMSRDISVAAHEGVITLTGFVHHYYEKMAAERAAKSVYGVKAVANDIEVKIAGTRSDPEIARDIIHAMAVDVTVPENRIKVGVRRATSRWRETLTGTSSEPVPPHARVASPASAA